MTIIKYGELGIEKIRKLEEKYNVKLPDDYVQFLMRYNGCRVETEEEDAILIRGINETFYLDLLYGIDTGARCANIDLWMDKYGDELPEGGLIIGDTLEHGFILMICGGEDAGIYYWDDTRYFDVSSDEENAFIITETFSELVKGMF